MIRVPLTRICAAAAVALALLASPGDTGANEPTRELRPVAVTSGGLEGLLPAAAADPECLAECREFYESCLEYSPHSVCVPAYARCVRACRR